MFKLDGSEISWLVYADWLEDQNKPNFIRSLLSEYQLNNWCFEYTTLSSDVGSFCSWSIPIEHRVGGFFKDSVGAHHNDSLNYPFVGVSTMNNVGVNTWQVLDGNINIGPYDLT